MTTHDSPPATDVPPWAGRWVLYLAGAGLLAFGLHGIVQNAHGWTHPLRWAILLAVGAVAHDLVLVPVVFALGLPLSRLTARGVRSYVATGLGLSLCLVAVAWPGLHSTGRLPDNSTVLPLDYGRGLALSLGALWTGLLVACAVSAVRRRRRSTLQVSP